MAALIDISVYEPSNRLRAVCDGATEVAVDPNTPAKRYFRSTIEMERMAKVYIDEGNVENALILYLRLISLLVEKLPNHPLYSQIPQQDIKTRKKKLVTTIFPTAETLKNKLRRKFEDEYEQKKEEQRVLAAENEKKAAQVEKEQTIAQEGIIKDEESIQNIIHKFAPSSVTINHGVLPDVPPIAPGSLSDYSTAPALSSMYPTSIKHKPESNENDETKIFPSIQTPQVNRFNKPEHLLDTKQSRLVPSLMNLHYPGLVVDKFMERAHINTSSNIETCGILCGKLSHGEFVITHLVILKQTGTADSCVTLNEEELFEVQDKYDLITLGWIHTHPSQTSFLSSVDLHTQFSYQQLLPEAIAIVCAPKYKEVGVYNLTQDHGLKIIGSCHQNGFHFHAKEPPLFKGCEHVIMSDSISLDVIDLR